MLRVCLAPCIENLEKKMYGIQLHLENERKKNVWISLNEKKKNAGCQDDKILT